MVWGPLGDNVATPDILQGVVMWSGFIYPKYRLFVIGFTAVFALLLWWLLEGTRLGSAVRAGGESTEMVSLLGINVYRVFGLVFALGAGTAALAGCPGGAHPRRAIPSWAWKRWGWLSSSSWWAASGGFAGALVGGLLIGIVQSVMSTLWPEGARLMIYVAMAAVLLLRPYGLLGEGMMRVLRGRVGLILAAATVLLLPAVRAIRGTLATKSWSMRSRCWAAICCWATRGCCPLARGFSSAWAATRWAS